MADSLWVPWGASGVELDEDARALFSPKRFAIAAYLYGRRWATMAELRRATGLTWGDLDSNIRLLQRKGLVEARKALTRAGPRTIVRLTPRGLSAFERLLAYLEESLGRLRHRQGSAEAH